MERREIIDYLRNEYDEQWLETLLKLVSLKIEFVKSINELEKDLKCNDHHEINIKIDGDNIAKYNHKSIKERRHTDDIKIRNCNGNSKNV